MARLVCIAALAIALPSAAGSAQNQREVAAVLEQLRTGEIGLNKVSNRLAFFGEDAFACERICAALREGAEPHWRGLLIQTLALVAVPGADVETVLIRGVGDDDLAVRMASIRGLARARATSAVPHLERALAVGLPGVRREAARALGLIGAGRSAAPLLAQAKREDDPEARAAMLGALGRVGERKLWPELERFLESDSESARLAAAQALISLGDPRGRAFAQALLRSEEKFERVQGVRLFEGAPLKVATPVLAPMLEDKAPQVRAVAARVLVQAGDKARLAWLVLESAKAQGEARLPYENELEALHLSDEVRKGILGKAGRQ